MDNLGMRPQIVSPAINIDRSLRWGSGIWEGKDARIAVYRGTISSHRIRGTYPAKVATSELGLEASISLWARVSVQYGTRGLSAGKSTAMINKTISSAENTTTPLSGSSGRYNVTYDRQCID